jgi:hypothetical protein
MSKQLITGKTYNNTGQVQHAPLVIPCYSAIGGPLFASLLQPDPPDTFGYSTPWSVAGTFKNLYVEIQWWAENPAGGGWPDIVFTLYINDAPTTLTVTVPAHPSSVTPPGYISSGFNIVNTVTIAPGDRVALIRGDGEISAGINQFTASIAWNLTFDSTNDGESGYGVSASGESPSDTSNVLISSPFTNFGGFGLAPFNQQGAVSIVPLEGSLYRLDVELLTAPGMGNSRSFGAILNGVIQDGTGITIDTVLTISDLATTGHKIFDLPLHVLDLLSIAQLTGGSGFNRAKYSVGLLADNPGEFALAYSTDNQNPVNNGDTDYAGGQTGGWAWSTAKAPTPSTLPVGRWPMSELSMSTPGPIDSYQLTSLCLYVTPAPGHSGSTGVYTFTSRKAFADTPTFVDVSGSSNLFVGTGNSGIYLGAADRMSLKAESVGTPDVLQTTWTWLVVAVDVPPASGSIYKIVPNKRNDTLFDIGDVKIPDPSFKTGLIGG